MAAANGIDPASNQTVTFDIGNKTYADSLQSTVLAPLIEQGLDLYVINNGYAFLLYRLLSRDCRAWTDWQQGFPGVSSIRGIGPTAILNHYRFHNFTAAVGVRG